MADPLAAIGVSRNPDGSLKRTKIPGTPALSDPNAATPVLSKDVPINPTTATSVRLFLPQTALNAAGSTKLPLIIYAHGGGFIISSAASAVSHHFCSTLALRTPAVVVSVDYRLAPEHRLPAAYDDCMEALLWVKTTPDEWIASHADLSNCYLMGTSAGGNIVFHVGLRAAPCADELKPMTMKGLILHQPYFGGVERTPSEIRLADNKTLSLSLSDIMWELSLPAGADRDHEYCNPMMGKLPWNLDAVREKRWKVTVTGCGGDPLVDRQKAVVEVLEEKGVAAVAKFVNGEYHGYDIVEPSKAEVIMCAVKEAVQISTS